jgi:hypothetical protein
MDIRLYVPTYHECVFLALMNARIPEPVIVVLLSLLPVNEHIMVQVDNDDREYEIVKAFEYELNDSDVAYFFEVVTEHRNSDDYHYSDTYLWWVANGHALGLFRLIINEEMLFGLEIATNWGESWLPWAYRQDGKWRGIKDNNPIQDFIVRRLIVAVDRYMEELDRI